MGREVRKVPAKWEHPKKENGDYQPLHDENYENAISEWFENHRLWLNGAHEDQKGDDPPKYKYYAEWDTNPPEIEYYRHYKDEECTHYQMYENVSEGTPISPVCATQEELVDWIVKNLGHSRKAAKQFVESGYAPSGVISNGTLKDGISAYDDVD